MVLGVNIAVFTQKRIENRYTFLIYRQLIHNILNHSKFSKGFSYKTEKYLRFHYYTPSRSSKGGELILFSLLWRDEREV